MSWLKDLYIKQLEVEMVRLESEGIPADKAYELAGQRAYYMARDAMVQEADLLRKRRKGH